MDLFAEQEQAALRRVQPLAVRMRPRTLDEFVGQEAFLGPGKLLRRLLEADRLTSAIFYGPPGSGKSTLARIIANHTQAAFETLHAAEAGVNDVRRIIDQAKARLTSRSQRTVLFLDEIHRFNRRFLPAPATCDDFDPPCGPAWGHAVTIASPCARKASIYPSAKALICVSWQAGAAPTSFRPAVSNASETSTAMAKWDCPTWRSYLRSTAPPVA
jgi:hypothetical protein